MEDLGATLLFVVVVVVVVVAIVTWDNCIGLSLSLLIDEWHFILFLSFEILCFISSAVMHHPSSSIFHLI